MERRQEKDERSVWEKSKQKIMSSRTANEDCLGWAARDLSGVLSPYKFSRRAVGDDDVYVKITYCGVCYADVGFTRNPHAKYPVVPGHEIVGIVKKIGSKVQGFNVGDHVGVGTYVNSCRNCDFCNDEVEVLCEKGAVYTFSGVDYDGTVTKGGYSSYIVVHARYCFQIPKHYPLASAAPLLCAGITVYSPMMRHNMNQREILSTSISKKEEALNVLGADKFVVSTDQEQMKASTKSLDFIIDTASVKFSPMSLNLGAKTVSGSAVGGTKQTREMINFCVTNKIYPNIEVIPIQYANEALERLINRDVKHRLVIDIENTLKEE
ncbi:hypothetical protein L6164_003100 [Bauhinia variegata]|uniref:Uncharacterized protein n=1 Tax=Bauhinia variegata TaxID=167791 RepID=A0ACB9Q2Z2_BAUVA|nr:hypothetical protein L6164_003100 [Bauhinia variegata]